MLYPPAKFDEWLNWWIPSNVIDHKPKVWQHGIRRQQRRHMIPMCWLCDSKRGYVYLTKRQQCNEYIHGVFATIKNYLLSLYCARVLKPFGISHNQTWASVVREPDSVACEQQRCRPVCASSQSDACLCNLLLESIIAKQLNLAHQKLQASI